jgi:hypothetical protein
MCLKIGFYQKGLLCAILDSLQKLDWDPISNLLNFRPPKGFVGISFVYRSYIVRYAPKKLRTNNEQITND